MENKYMVKNTPQEAKKAPKTPTQCDDNIMESLTERFNNKCHVSSPTTPKRKHENHRKKLCPDAPKTLGIKKTKKHPTSEFSLTTAQLALLFNKSKENSSSNNANAKVARKLTF